MQYWYFDKNQVVVCYCGSLFLGYCDSGKMRKHSFSFQTGVMSYFYI